MPQSRTPDRRVIQNCVLSAKRSRGHVEPSLLLPIIAHREVSRGLLTTHGKPSSKATMCPWLSGRKQTAFAMRDRNSHQLHRRILRWRSSESPGSINRELKGATCIPTVCRGHGRGSGNRDICCGVSTGQLNGNGCCPPPKHLIGDGAKRIDIRIAACACFLPCSGEMPRGARYLCRSLRDTLGWWSRRQPKSSTDITSPESRLRYSPTRVTVDPARHGNAAAG